MEELRKQNEPRASSKEDLPSAEANPPVSATEVTPTRPWASAAAYQAPPALTKWFDQEELVAAKQWVGENRRNRDLIIKRHDPGKTAVRRLLVKERPAADHGPDGSEDRDVSERYFNGEETFSTPQENISGLKVTSAEQVVKESGKIQGDASVVVEGVSVAPKSEEISNLEAFFVRYEHFIGLFFAAKNTLPPSVLAAIIAGKPCSVDEKTRGFLRRLTISYGVRHRCCSPPRHWKPLCDKRRPPHRCNYCGWVIPVDDPSWLGLLDKWLNEVAAMRGLHRLELEAALLGIKDDRRRALIATAVDRQLREALPRPVREEPWLSSGRPISSATINSLKRVRVASRRKPPQKKVWDRRPRFVQTVAARALDPDRVASSLHPDRPAGGQLAPPPPERTVTEYATDRVAGANELLNERHKWQALDTRDEPESRRLAIRRAVNRLLWEADQPGGIAQAQRELLVIGEDFLAGREAKEIAIARKKPVDTIYKRLKKLEKLGAEIAVE